jgi:hypothetical protein
MPAATSRNRANHWRGTANPAPALRLLKEHHPGFRTMGGDVKTSTPCLPRLGKHCLSRRFEGASQLRLGAVPGLFFDPAIRYPAARMTDADSAEPAGSRQPTARSSRHCSALSVKPRITIALLAPRRWSANFPDGYTGTHLVTGLIGFDCDLMGGTHGTGSNNDQVSRRTPFQGDIGRRTRKYLTICPF